MTFWKFIDKLLDRMPGWPNGRGLTGAATFSLTVMIILLMVEYPELREDEFFKVIATALVLTGFVNSVIPFFYGQNQLNSEASLNSKTAFETMGKQAEATVAAAVSSPPQQNPADAAARAAEETAEAAVHKAEEIKESM